MSEENERSSAGLEKVCVWACTSWNVLGDCGGVVVWMGTECRVLASGVVSVHNRAP